MHDECLIAMSVLGSSASLPKLLDRLLDGVFDENGGIAEGGVALRSALRRQDLTRR